MCFCTWTSLTQLASRLAGPYHVGRWSSHWGYSIWWGRECG